MAIKVSIKQVQPQKIPVKITSGTGGLLQVEHDNTLVGLGTTTVPLGINPEYTQELTDKIGTVADALADETTNREQADESLRQEIKDNTESIGNNTDAINALNTNLNAEITAREQGDVEINKAISALNSGLQAESTARADADAVLQGNIDSEASTRASEDAKLAADIAKNSTAISDEATARNQADAALQDSITKESTTRSNADKALQGGIDAEATARTEADTALQTSITKNAGDITTLRNDVDGLGDQVHEIEAKVPADASTSNQLATKADVSGLETSLAKVAKTGSYNDLGDKPTIGNAVLTITRNNESAGSFSANATENQTINIAVPVSAGDVNALPDTTKYGASVSLTMDSTTYKVSASLKDQNGDVLGTVQTIDLPLESVVVSGTYDATTKEVVLTLQDGSEIRFSVADLVDGLQTEITETNKLSADLVDDSTTVNKFVTSAEKNTWNSKQDAISDLADIRAGAQKGATAVQPAAIADMETKTNAAATYQPKGDYATSTELATGLATKADTTTTDTLRNDIDGLGDQVQEIEAKIPGDATASNQLATKADLENVSVAVDGITITKKADGKIQASAVVNQNSGVLKSWTGTLAQYTALETKSDDTQYIITDDDSAGTNVYTKAEVDSLVNNALANADYVIAFQAPTAENNYTWYRKYKSGWVEQGGCLLNAATGAHTITIPIEMASVEELKKSVIVTPIYISGAISSQGVSVRNSNDSSWGTTQIDCFSWGATIHIKWQVSGMAQG